MRDSEYLEYLSIGNSGQSEDIHNATMSLERTTEMPRRHSVTWRPYAGTQSGTPHELHHVLYTYYVVVQPVKIDIPM